MDDLISRKALLEELQEAYDNAHRILQNQYSPESKAYCKLQLRTLHSVIKDVKEAPTINAVEVVRCKECRRGFEDKSTMEGRVYCVNWGQFVKADGFCYMAQKEDRPPIVFRKYKPFKPDEVVTGEPDWSNAGDPNIKDLAMALRETIKKDIKAVIAEAMNESKPDKSDPGA